MHASVWLKSAVALPAVKHVSGTVLSSETVITQRSHTTNSLNFSLEKLDLEANEKVY